MTWQTINCLRSLEYDNAVTVVNRSKIRVTLGVIEYDPVERENIRRIGITIRQIKSRVSIVYMEISYEKIFTYINSIREEPIKKISEKFEILSPIFRKRERKREISFRVRVIDDKKKKEKKKGRENKRKESKME